MTARLQEGVRPSAAMPRDMNAAAQEEGAHCLHEERRCGAMGSVAFQELAGMITCPNRKMVGRSRRTPGANSEGPTGGMGVDRRRPGRGS